MEASFLPAGNLEALGILFKIGTEGMEGQSFGGKCTYGASTESSVHEEIGAKG